MVFVYDFDGTLTPYGAPQYACFLKRGMASEEFLKSIIVNMNKWNVTLSEAYYGTTRDTLHQFGEKYCAEIINEGAKEIAYNPGVLEYVKEMHSWNDQVAHYCLTAGYRCYVEETLVGPYFKEVYGPTFTTDENGEFDQIVEDVYDVTKPDYVKRIMEKENASTVVYVGDGLTDRYGFEYVNQIGGYGIFVGQSEEPNQDYLELSSKGIVKEYYQADYRPGSALYKRLRELGEK